MRFVLPIVMGGVLYSGMMASGFSSAYLDCVRHPRSMAAMRQCTHEEWQRQERRLTRAYRAAMDSLGPRERRELRDVQRAWIRYRDARCDFIYDREGGSMAGLAAETCKMEMAEHRAGQLWRIAE